MASAGCGGSVGALAVVGGGPRSLSPADFLFGRRVFVPVLIALSGFLGSACGSLAFLTRATAEHVHVLIRYVGGDCPHAYVVVCGREFPLDLQCSLSGRAFKVWRDCPCAAFACLDRLLNHWSVARISSLDCVVSNMFSSALSSGAASARRFMDSVTSSDFRIRHRIRCRDLSRWTRVDGAGVLRQLVRGDLLPDLLSAVPELHVELPFVLGALQFDVGNVGQQLLIDSEDMPLNRFSADCSSSLQSVHRELGCMARACRAVEAVEGRARFTFPSLAYLLSTGTTASVPKSIRRRLPASGGGGCGVSSDSSEDEAE